MKPALWVVSFVLTFSAAVPVAGPAEGVLWFEAGHESGGARGVQGAVEELFSADNQNDIDRLAALIKSKGGVLSHEPQTQPWGERDFGLVDPDGFRITFSSGA